MAILSNQNTGIILKKFVTEPKAPGRYMGEIESINEREKNDGTRAYVVKFIVTQKKIPCGTKEKWFNLDRKQDLELWNKLVDLLEDLEDADANEAIGKKVGIEITVNFSNGITYSNISDFYKLGTKKKRKSSRQTGGNHD